MTFISKNEHKLRGLFVNSKLYLIILNFRVAIQDGTKMLRLSPNNNNTNA